MVTGVECAGLVLAVLPLFIKAGEAYANGVDIILNVSLRSRRDGSLSDFYDEFYWAIGELEGHINTVSTAISNSSKEHQPSSTLKLDEWTQNSEVEKRLRRYLGSDAAYNMFSTTAKRIVQLLAQLLKNESEYLANKDLDESQMFQKLKAFASDRASNRTQSRFMERFVFFKKEKHRKKCLEKLGCWNARLKDLIQATGSSRHTMLLLGGPHASLSQGKNDFFLALRNSSAPARQLTRKLYDAFASSWQCSCSGGHEAKFCLYLGEASQTANANIVDLDFFITTTPTQSSTHCWQEGTVSACSVSTPRADDGTKLQRVCDALQMCMKDFRLRILMEDVGNGQQSQQFLWRLDPKPKRIHFLETETPVSLGDLLIGSAKMGPLEKRQLALICSYSLLLFHDSPWLSGGWNKSSLSFFFNSEDEPDFMRPYLSTRFDNPARQVGQPGSGVFHRNSNILTLGILLIEIHNEKPIECWRNRQQRASLTSATEDNINYLVASRIVRKMDISPYRSSIEACLDLDWVKAGQSVRLEDDETRKGLYTNVIQPLEKELQLLS